MSRLQLFLVLCVIGLFRISLPAFAEDPGMETFNQAIELKFSAQTIPDFAQVIRLCEKSMDEGLTEDNLEFCKQMLGATRLLRGKIIAELILDQFGTMKEWAQIRNMAFEDLNEAVKYLPDQSAAYLLIAKLNLLPDGDREAAKSAIEKAVEFAGDDNHARAEAMIAKADFEEDPEKRLEILREAVSLQPDSPIALAALGTELFRQEKSDESLEILRKAVDLEPDNPNVLTLIVGILLNLEKYDEALRVVEMQEGLDPNSPFPRLQKMDIFLAQKNYDEALKILNELRDKAPGNPMIYLQRALIYFDKKDYDLALKDIDSAFRLAEDDSDVVRRGIFLRTTILVKQEKYAEAIKYLKDIIAKKTDKSQQIYQLLLVQTYLNAKVNAKALALIDELLVSDPESPDLLRLRADTLLGLGRHQEAIAEYEKLLAKDPDDSGVLNNLSWVLATSPDDSLRDGKKALEYALKSCELTKYEFPHILSTLASAYAELGEFDKAIEWIDKGLELAESQGYEQKEHLDKEHASYVEKRPWRELIDEDHPDPTEEPNDQ